MWKKIAVVMLLGLSSSIIWIIVFSCEVNLYLAKLRNKLLYKAVQIKGNG